MNGKRTFIINGFLFSAAPFFPKLVSILLLPIMTKYLTASDYGIAATINAYSGSIAAFSTLGLGVVLSNTYFKDPDNYKETWRKIYGFLNCWMIVYAIIQASILFFCIPNEAIENRWWIILLTNFSTVLFGPTSSIGSSYFVNSKQAFPVVWRSVLSSIITMLATFTLVVYAKTGYMGWYVGGFIGTFFSNMTYWPVVNFRIGIKPSYKFKIEEIKQHLRVSFPTIPHYYSNYMMDGASKIIADQNHVSQDKIGELSVSQMLGGIFQTGVMGLGNAVSPYCMSYIKEDTGKAYTKLALSYIICVFLIAFCVSLWSKEIFQILFSNETLANCYHYSIVYMMAMCYRPVYTVATYYYFYYENTKKLLFITFMSGLIAIACYMVLIPFINIWGIFIGFYVSSLYYGYSAFFYDTYKEHSIDSIPYVGIFFLQILLTIVAYISVDFLLFKSLMTIVFGAAAMYLYMYKIRIKK